MKKGYLVVLILFTLIISISADIIRVANIDNGVKVIESNSSKTVLEMQLGSFNSTEVLINNRVFNKINLNKEAETYQKGAPEVPTVTRSVIIDDTSQPELKLLASEYTELNLDVVPSKGIITRDMDPKSIPYSFAETYNQNDFFPGNLSTLGSAYIMRNYRGVTVTFNPFQYNPVTNVLRVYTSIKVAVVNSSNKGENILTRKAKQVESFDFIYKNHFLNYQENRYDPLDEFGSILVIAPQNYIPTMEIYADWKKQKGIPTEIIDVATIGNNGTSIKNYIQDYYNTNDDLAFVQIAGDGAQVATLSSGGGGADPMYALVAGNDTYPDIFIGRFSAETVDQLATQVERTVHYERDMNSSATYLTKALGVASAEGGGSQGDMGESDITHMNNIRSDLLAYNYDTVDQVYDPGASSTQVANSINNGRGFVNYIGHGSNTSWSTTGFSVSHVNNLTNTDKLPFIVSVACVNGNFVNYTCFAEAWMRATHNNSPSGAMAIYASSINQSWASPMRGQDEITDLLVAEELSTIGGLFYSGSAAMMDAYGYDGINMFKTWHIFGDASLQVRTNTPEDIELNHTGIMFIGANDYSVNTGLANALVSISNNEGLITSGYTDDNGAILLNMDNAPLTPQELTLTVTALNKITAIEPITLTPAEGSFIVIDNVPNPITHIGYSGNFSFDIKNVGVEEASDLNITISTDQAGVMISDNEEIIESINADQIISLPEDAFTLYIPYTIENDYRIPLTVNISANNGANEWEYGINLINQAPDLTIQDIDTSEIYGNGNQRFEAGETFLFTLPISNEGAYPAELVNVLANLPMGMAATENALVEIYNLEEGQEEEITFEITLSSQIENGEELAIDFVAEYGNFSTTYSFSSYVGLTIEDFESQDLSIFGWETNGTYTFSSHAYEGQYSLKSADIGSNGTTSLSMQFEVDTPGELSFWMHVSTEQNYDEVNFSINGQEELELSGNTGWVNYTFALDSGMNNLEWVYNKDFMVDSNDDCFYLDYVVFPASPANNYDAPEISINTSEFNFSDTLTDEFSILPITITNNADGIGIVSFSLDSPFFILDDNDNLLRTFSLIIDPNSEETANLAFSPSRPGDHTEEFTLITDDPNNSEIIITLSGSGVSVSNDDQAIPAVTALKGNYPNPFNPETTISFGIHKAGKVELTVFNLLGQKVKTLVNDYKEAGNHNIVWNGRDKNNKNVASGVYFYKLSTADYSKTEKMILMK